MIKMTGWTSSRKPAQFIRNYCWPVSVLVDPLRLTFLKKDPDSALVLQLERTADAVDLSIDMLQATFGQWPEGRPVTTEERLTLERLQKEVGKHLERCESAPTLGYLTQWVEIQNPAWGHAFTFLWDPPVDVLESERMAHLVTRAIDHLLEKKAGPGTYHIRVDVNEGNGRPDWRVAATIRHGATTNEPT